MALPGTEKVPGGGSFRFKAEQFQKMGVSVLKLGKSWELGQIAHLIHNAQCLFPLKTDQVISESWTVSWESGLLILSVRSFSV